ncbi:phage terminase small subunit [Megasphaera sp. BL7]|uniref:terminase small subunit n=1 Tax=unclassified Megasphaera TaxID=2626256 RepID=UPI000356F225|nr:MULTISPECIES: terminase small subunit [unclassified Megasphaera]EPP15862.1 phage terminase small subunit [Megasphaera sp. BL7]EPP18937.1 phage terminase small subunit [Megasphaera sp. NM10]
MDKLTLKQKRFVDAYIETGNATEAARMAGYSKKTANRIGTENLSKLVIRRAIQERLDAMEAAKTATPEEVMQHLTAAMRGEIREEHIVSEGTGEGCSRARIMKKQISAHDRLKAAELLLKRYPTKPAREEQELRNEKLRAEVADLNTHTDEEAVAFEFSRKSETTEEN